MLSDFYRNEKVRLKKAFGGDSPVCFLRPSVEYDALVRACGVIDLTHRRILCVRGTDRAAFLNAMLTSDMASLEAGDGGRGLLTTVKGKLISELFVFARKTDHLVVVSQGDFEQTLGDLRGHIISEDVTIDDVSPQYGILGVEGPDARDVIHRLLGKGPLPASEYAHLEREFETFGVIVLRMSATGEPGYHVMVPAGEVLRIRNYLVQAARGSDGLPAGLAACDARRVESGVPWYGIDFTGENFPQEARLGNVVSYTKGCFRGQETLARLHHQGHVNQLLVGLAVEGESFVRAAADAGAWDVGGLFPHGSPIHDRVRVIRPGESSKAEPIGRVTSAVFSPALRAPLLLGFVRRELLEETPDLFVDTPHGRATVRVIELPIASRTC